jgi:uncharacterized protein YpuA (DUF1002 family)
MVNWKSLEKRIPNLVQLKRKTKYEVCYIESFLDESVLGETRFDSRLIVIKSSQTPKEKVHTYIHELLHAISEEYNVGLTETQVQALERAVYYILKNNNVFKKR